MSLTEAATHTTSKDKREFLWEGFIIIDDAAFCIAPLQSLNNETCLNNSITQEANRLKILHDWKKQKRIWQCSFFINTETQSDYMHGLELELT